MQEERVAESKIINRLTGVGLLLAGFWYAELQTVKCLGVLDLDETTTEGIKM
jgi:hypothetical protein